MHLKGVGNVLGASALSKEVGIDAVGAGLAGVQRIRCVAVGRVADEEDPGRGGEEVLEERVRRGEQPLLGSLGGVETAAGVKALIEELADVSSADARVGASAGGGVAEEGAVFIKGIRTGFIFFLKKIGGKMYSACCQVTPQFVWRDSTSRDRAATAKSTRAIGSYLSP